jgi:UDP-N-acetylmuramyl pentapeptide phosphotransferase/UDP-N-acetylglucosamine-1-phosphate transferase
VISLTLAFAISAAVTLMILRSAKTHGHRAADRDFTKPQGFHAVAVPRIGGLGIVLGICGATAALALTRLPEAGGLGSLLMVSALPVFLAGFIQDFTGALTPRRRLLASAASAALAFYLIDAGIQQTGIPVFDWVAGFAMGSLLLTIVAVAGIANAVNIIDGFNGLAAMCAVLMLAALSYVCFQVNDPMLALLALAGIGAVLGFFLWNFPGGLIFLGDGGAYFLGFFVAEISILLVRRNPGEVSPLFPLLVCIYPVFETVFSIYRRKFLRAVPPSMPDGIHLHSLIYRRLLRWAVGDQSARALTRRNSRTAPFLWLLCMLSVIPAVLFFNSTLIQAGFLVLFAASYVILYWRIVRFRSPRWMRALASHSAALREGDNHGT